jgi:HSP20 family protein
MYYRWRDFDTTFAALNAFRRRMDRLFDDYNEAVREDPGLLAGGTWPQMSVADGGDELLLNAEVPGLSEGDVQITLDRNVLTLAGVRRVSAPEGYSAHRQERGSYSFNRSLSLPCEVDPEKARATVKDGILTVSLAKAEAAKPRQITVKAS